MNTKKSTSFYIISAAVFCIAYIILAVKPLGSEFQFEPCWKIDVTNPTISEASESVDPISFKLGQSMGYFSEDGKVYNFITFPQKASISERYYTFYNNNCNSATIYTPDGKVKAKIEISGFPMIDNDRTFVFLPGGSSFLMCDDEGKTKWEYGGTIPITAFDSSSSGIAAGFADGNICHFDTDGNLIQRFSPGGSQIPVVLGVAISESGEYVAAICGQNKQRFILAKKDSAQTKIIQHEFLDSKETKQRLVKFSKDNSTVYYNSGNILGIMDVKTGKKRHLRLEGQAISLKESEKCVFVLTKNKNRYTVYVIEKFATLSGHFSFEADSAFIQTKDSMLFVGKNSTISCIKIGQQ